MLPNTFRRPSTKIAAALAVASLAAVAALAFRDRVVPEVAAAQTVGAAPGQAQPAADQPTLLYKQAVRVWVHADGVRPRVVHAAPGLVVLRVENETGADATLVVERVVAAHQARIGAARLVTPWLGKRAHAEVAIGAGEYVYYEESRPQLTGRLVVEPRGQ